MPSQCSSPTTKCITMASKASTFRPLSNLNMVLCLPAKLSPSLDCPSLTTPWFLLPQPSHLSSNTPSSRKTSMIPQTRLGPSAFSSAHLSRMLTRCEILGKMSVSSFWPHVGPSSIFNPCCTLSGGHRAWHSGGSQHMGGRWGPSHRSPNNTRETFWMVLLASPRVVF